MRKICLLLTVIFVFSLFSVPCYSAQAENGEIELTDTEEYKKLVSFGVLSEDSELEFYDEIPRNIFVMHAMKCCLTEDSLFNPEKAESIFSDVNVNTEGASEIAAAYEMGIIDANSGEFRPQDSITAYEAAKILVSVLGYADIAGADGGYPNGYLKWAYRLDLFNKCKATEDGFFDAYNFLVLLLNTLETDVAEVNQVQQNDKDISAGYAQGKTLLEKTFSIRRTEGVVESNEFTSIKGLSDLSEGFVKINNVLYLKEESEAENLLGYNTECYFKTDISDDMRKIIYIAPYRNDVVTVQSENIKTESLTLTNFSYYKDEDGRKSAYVKIAKSAALIYNGGQKAMNVENLHPANGYVTLIDNDRNGAYDVVISMNYKSFLVSNVSLSTYTITDAYCENSVVLDPEDKEYGVRIRIDGITSDFASIPTQCILSYAQSSGNKKNVKYVEISTKTIEGIIEAKGTDTVVIDGVEYRVDKALMDELSLHNSAVFYFDSFDRIVAYMNMKDVVYGYLFSMGKQSTLSKTIQAKIFTENDRWVILDINDKILYNGKREQSEKFYNDCSGNPQLIQYTVDTDGKINMVNIAQSFQKFSSAENDAIEKDLFRVYPVVQNAYYRSNLRALAPSGSTPDLLVSDSTKIFTVPDWSKPDASEEDIKLLAAGKLRNSQQFSKIVPYDIDKSRVAGAMVIVDYTPEVDLTSSFMVVDSIVYVKNSKDEFVKGIKGYYKNTLLTLAAADDSVDLSKFGKGDVVQIFIDNNGDISQIGNKWCDYNEIVGGGYTIAVKSTPDTYAHNTNVMITGKARYTMPETNKIIAEINGNSNDCGVIGVDKNTVIHLYDTETKTLSEGTISDISGGNKFYANVTYYVADEILVYQ